MVKVKPRVLSMVFLFVALNVGAAARAGWYSETQGIMGTEVNVTLWHEDASAAQLVIDAVMSEMRRIDSQLSPYKSDSELSILNQTASEQDQPISAELNTLIDKSLYFSRLTSGAFDITFASLAQYYDYREGKIPSDTIIRESLPAINYKWLRYDKKAATLGFTHPKVKIDLGGVAKGWAVDRGVAILKQKGISHASVSAGGDSRVLGDRRGRPWIIGIKHPRQSPDEPEQAVVRLPLEDVSVSTSGDYERFFIDEANGERVHHIINPSTGKSASEVMSVTVLGDDGLDTDPLSTSVFVLGVKKGLELVNLLPNFDAVIIDINGKVHYSDGLASGHE